MRLRHTILAGLFAVFTILGGGLTHDYAAGVLHDVEAVTGLKPKYPFTIKVVKPWQIDKDMAGQYLPGRSTIIISEDHLDRLTLGHEMAHVIYFDHFGPHPERWAEDVERRLGR